MRAYASFTPAPVMGWKVMSRISRFLCAMVASMGVASAALDVAQAATKKPVGPQVSRKVLPPLKAATEAFTAKQFDVVVQKLQEADAIAGKTPYDQFRIDELRALTYINQNTNFGEALAIYERHQNEPQLSWIDPNAANLRLKVMTQLAFRTQAHDKVNAFGKQWLATHPDDTGVLDLMARSSYISKDFKSTIEIANTAIGIAEAAGTVPQELWLQLVPSCATQLDDQPLALAGYRKLVRYYNKPEHWNKALEGLLHTEKHDAATIHILRLMADTGVLTRPEYLMEYAQRAMDKALPGEALRILESGLEKQIIGSGKNKDNHVRALTEARAKAKSDQAQLPQIEKEVAASKAANGQLEVGLGLAYFSFGMYDQAIQLFEAGITKGNLRNLDDTRMMLGMAYWKAGQKEKAREQFEKIEAASPLNRIAGLWASRTYN